MLASVPGVRDAVVYKKILVPIELTFQFLGREIWFEPRISSASWSIWWDGSLGNREIDEVGIGL